MIPERSARLAGFESLYARFLVRLGDLDGAGAALGRAQQAADRLEALLEDARQSNVAIDAENRRLLGDIQRLHHEHAGRYGSPRIHIAIGEEGWTVNQGGWRA
jgi:hypothetical protein